MEKIKGKLLIPYWKAILISSLLLISIYEIGVLTNWSNYNLIFTIISYLLFSLIGFNFNLNKTTGDLWRFDTWYLFICIVGTLGIFLLNISLPNTIYLLLGKGLMVERKISSLDIFTSLTIYPVIEEIFFRKYLARGLYNSYGFKKALLISSAIFAILHLFSGNGILIVFMIGLFLGYIYLKTNSILLSILIHSFSNFLVLYVAPLMQEGTIDYFETNSLIYIWFFVILLGVVLLIIFYKNFNFEKGKEGKKTQDKTGKGKNRILPY